MTNQSGKALPGQGIPEKPSLDGLEERWIRQWEADGTYRFDRTASREQVYSIDTPPPTVSGNLHIGSVFSYTHTDLIARFWRMRGREVFYPMGWDDNGLPTERRVQNYFGVRCDPSLPYDPDFEPPAEPAKEQLPTSRRNFIELCERLVAQDEQSYEELWRRLGLSVDWSLIYSTIGSAARAASQRAFLRNLARGEAYQAEAPTLWDVSFQTAVAQAELEDHERPGAFHRIRFGSLEIETTRPELLPACVALVAHPDDERYQRYFGTTVPTPLFGVRVPVRPHHLADPGKGTGLAMVCTFGDVTDVLWWRELDLSIRAVLGRDGRFSPEPPTGLDSASAKEAYAGLAGRTVKQARRRIVELLRESDDLIGEPRPIRHPVKFYEKSDQPLEIVTSRQWYIRNGGTDPALAQAFLERGRDLAWVPDYMRHRYEHWINGLTTDWLISRQRYFGVPIPVWYRLGPDGEPEYDRPLLPAEDRLPVDPASDAPDGYAEEQRGKPDGFIADPDVMDTWATSSLTPQIACGWERDPDLFARTFPMDLNTHAHEIIRTWLVYRVVRSHFEHGTLPWHHTMVSGWVVDPERKKLSKSKGTAVTPISVLEKYGTDAVRWRAAGARPGMDTPFDETQMKIGRRLAIKLLNAGKFVLSFDPPVPFQPAAPHGKGPRPWRQLSENHEITERLDKAMLAGLAEVVDRATVSFEAYDYTSALEATESFFWTFCDDYLELVKERAYTAGSPGSASARAALRLGLSVQLRLFAPVMPYVTEEVWSWWQDGSIHRASWPTRDELPAGVPEILRTVSRALSAIRGVKSERKLSMRAELHRVELSAPPADIARLSQAEPDLKAAGRVTQLTLTPATPTDPITVTR